ncbi:cytochrome p450 [Moniliophthora roreri MCA 2997]|uniref:Cytochrome p450 n=1 Tax=Moniliophthora roreri (strain MCA 2997) TaxID=1381753 RepID=V2XDS2_MONRO|nr:cytochrome p450 [Moniliophthora roreri MCA 2997]KAI3614827.1 cytochrome p450 [Moniliophthora roreri]
MPPTPLPPDHLYYWLQAYPLPPGPPSLPLIGNLHYISSKDPWVGISALGRDYGDVIYFHGLGYRVVVLNALEAINQLLEKRSDVYSHRPQFVLAGELMGLNQVRIFCLWQRAYTVLTSTRATGLMNYGPEWREHRKLAHVSLNATAVKRYHPLQEDIAATLCRELLDDPKNFYEHARVAAGRVVMSVTYGLSLNAGNEYVNQTMEVMSMLSQTIVPAAHLCDILPALKYLPSWFPFQKYASKWRARVERDIINMPFEHVKEEMRRGIARPSFAYNIMSPGSEKSHTREHCIKWVLGSMFTAGTETTQGVLLTFILAMARHPEKQRLAQAELDALLCKENRLPLMSDMPKLPYVNALIKETLRWRPILPFSIGRLTSADDEYLGYTIPKGTIVVPNLWAIAFAPNDKYGPEEFLPERFLDEKSGGTADPFSYIFGFGRRICPGNALGQNSLFIFIASILYSFDISPANSHPKFLSGLIR